jgi:hypothetical protein
LEYYFLQILVLKVLKVEAGLFNNFSRALSGRGIKIPPQFGQIYPNISFAQSEQKVHSNEQMYAPSKLAGKSLSQHSHPGLISNILIPY